MSEVYLSIRWPIKRAYLQDKVFVILPLLIRIQCFASEVPSTILEHSLRFAFGDKDKLSPIPALRLPSVNAGGSRKELLGASLVAQWLRLWAPTAGENESETSLSHVWLSVTPWTVQARILEWVAFPFSRGSSQPRNRTVVSCVARWILHPLSYQGSPIAGGAGSIPGRGTKIPHAMWHGQNK